MRYSAVRVMNQIDTHMGHLRDALDRMPFARRRLRKAHDQFAHDMAHLIQLLDNSLPYLSNESNED